MLLARCSRTCFFGRAAGGSSTRAFFPDPVLLIARKNLFYWVDPVRLVKFENESFLSFGGRGGETGKINICVSAEFIVWYIGHLWFLKC